ncbi:T9SS C-terminal target domain-containing protein [Fibrisoma montanum]|uniref:T9SS C-terminal target domain-containing protein n=1 Tax=Fibrisoma montanum TaxID=2305895 RepID=A0A418MIK8_9BACT|nr:right-handed parallel beta-helix repeat-containing protein [Fibrisoma montanum]RIV27247.1 T9SS C-terminal target domain-containing protein [Fibrisoma montanum]
MRFWLILLTMTLAGRAWAQSCNCTYTITKTGSYDGKTLKIGPGATVCIQAGRYDFLRLNNFVGTPANPIKFVNCGGLVEVNFPTGSATGIAIQGSRYFQITGTGVAGLEYGIHISRTGSGISGLNITGMSSDCEVDHVEVSNAGFAGIMIKTDPTCDVSTQRANFAMYNVKVHHNYVHDVKGEGLYIGNSFWNEGQSRTCDGASVKLLPHNIYGLEISYNRTVNTGCEGIQYACAPESQVHHNSVFNSGIDPFDPYQDNGVQIGGGVSGNFYNNTIQKAKGIGLIIVGHLGPNRIYNNVITEAVSNGIFVDERAGTRANVEVALINNTIFSTGEEGVKLYNETQTTTLLNNAVVQVAGNRYLSTLNNKVRFTALNNYTAASAGEARFVDAPGGNLRPGSGSPLLNTGQNTSRYGVVADLDDRGRPQGGVYDIGAYEGGASGARQGVTSEAVAAEASELVLVRAYPSPVTDQLVVRLSNEEPIAELSIVDNNGRVISRHAAGTPVSELRLPVGHLGKGLYLLRVGTTSRQYGGRFLKN